MIYRLEQDLKKLGSIGVYDGGVFRPSLSDADIEAREFVKKLMLDAGLEIQIDRAANIIGIRKGKKSSPFVTTGSHIDAGKRWGIFDGTLGVIGAIEAVRMMNEENIDTELPLAIICFTDEEGTYEFYSGSKYFTGLISKEELYQKKNKYDGQIFGDLVKKALPTKVIERFSYPIKYHIELHIEQGPILEAKRKEIGVVSGIVGIRWLNLTFIGKQSHAGTTPMNLRNDPTIPASETILYLRKIVTKYPEMVGTSGLVKVSPNVINVIPGQVEVGIDLRSLIKSDMEKALDEVTEEAKKFAEEEGCKVSFSILEAQNPVPASPEVMEVIKKSAEFLKYSYIVMPSRAGHDTQNMAKITKVGMIFVPSKGGISHAPEEWTDFDQAHKGVEVLKRSLVELAGEGR
jgi:hydantoinase/carbamoylase family amidase